MIPDDFFSDPPKHYALHMSRRQRERIHAAWRRAQRFEFSPKASGIAGRLRQEAQSLIVENRQFAIPPFTTMYVEADSKEFFKSSPVATTPDTDDRLGYLIDGNDVFIFAAGNRRHGISPWFYRLNDSSDGNVWSAVARDLKEDPEAWKWIKLAMLLGSASSTPAAQRAADEIINSVSLNAMFDISKLSEGDLGHMIGGSVGDLANLWTFLLWLNQPKRIIYTDRPYGRRISKGKLKVYSSHRTVDIELGKARTISRAFLAGWDRLPSKRHDVRGSFHHHGGLQTGCGHDWAAQVDERLWECRKCHRRRWWVREHERGDLSRGRIVHDYAVSAGDRESRVG
jgi:hypothetical protein